MADKSDILQGTLDLMVLKTLDSLGALHGFGIARRIQQVSEDALYLNQGTLYPALLRLEQRGWISSKWGVSDNNRKAKYYSLTRAGRAQLERELAQWERLSQAIGMVIRMAAPYDGRLLSRPSSFYSAEKPSSAAFTSLGNVTTL